MTEQKDQGVVAPKTPGLCPYAEDGVECLLETHSVGPCLCATPLSSPAQETPIAWRYQRKEGWEGVWRYSSLPITDQDFETPSDWVTEPLYASPRSGQAPEPEHYRELIDREPDHGQYRVPDGALSPVRSGQSDAPAQGKCGTREPMALAHMIEQRPDLPLTPDDWRQICAALRTLASPRSGQTGADEPWRDIATAPKNETKFLLRLPNGEVTTAYFYWYTEGDYEAFRPVAYWALQDAIRDTPLDEEGPIEEMGLYFWRPIPPHSPGETVGMEELTDFFTPQFVHRRDAASLATIILSKFDLVRKSAALPSTDGGGRSSAS